ncbi:hypothetical protein [Micromonospora sp. NBC_00617]|uniref:hypothetical protein n=1 Tax=Micromonospora sp. NBC_00617 TaxID=2903587 RepID=UPI00386EC144
MRPRRRCGCATACDSGSAPRAVWSSSPPRATPHSAAGAEAADKAVGVLVDWAAHFDAVLLRKLGTRILDHVAPEVADAAAEAALRAQESREARDRHVTVSEQPNGRLRLSGILDTEAAALLRTGDLPENGGDVSADGPVSSAGCQVTRRVAARWASPAGASADRHVTATSFRVAGRS